MALEASCRFNNNPATAGNKNNTTSTPSAKAQTNQIFDRLNRK